MEKKIRGRTRRSILLRYAGWIASLRSVSLRG